MIWRSATEFYTGLGTRPCGHRQSVADRHGYQHHFRLGSRHAVHGHPDLILAAAIIGLRVRRAVWHRHRRGGHAVNASIQLAIDAYGQSPTMRVGLPR